MSRASFPVALALGAGLSCLWVGERGRRHLSGLERDAVADQVGRPVADGVIMDGEGDRSAQRDTGHEGRAQGKSEHLASIEAPSRQKPLLQSSTTTVTEGLRPGL